MLFFTKEKAYLKFQSDRGELHQLWYLEEMECHEWQFVCEKCIRYVYDPDVKAGNYFKLYIRSNQTSYYEEWHFSGRYCAHMRAKHFNFCNFWKRWSGKRSKNKLEKLCDSFPFSLSPSSFLLFQHFRRIFRKIGDN